MSTGDITRFRSFDEARAHEIEEARRTPLSEKFDDLMDLVQAGYMFKMDALRIRHPDETAEQIRERFQRWLEGDDGRAPESP